MNKKGKMFSTWMGISPQSNGWQAVENVRVPNCAIVVGVIEAQKTRYLLLNLNLKKNDPSRNKSRFYHVKKKQRALYFVYAARVDCQSLISIFGEFIFKKTIILKCPYENKKRNAKGHARCVKDHWPTLYNSLRSSKPDLILTNRSERALHHESFQWRASMKWKLEKGWTCQDAVPLERRETKDKSSYIFMEGLHHVRERRFSKFMSGVSGYSSLCLIPDSKLSLLISAQMFTNTTVIIGYAIKCHPCRNKVTNTHARKPCPFWLAFWVTWGGQGEKCSLQFSSIKHKNPNYCIYSKKGFPRAVET